MAIQPSTRIAGSSHILRFAGTLLRQAVAGVQTVNGEVIQAAVAGTRTGVRFALVDMTALTNVTRKLPQDVYDDTEPAAASPHANTLAAMGPGTATPSGKTFAQNIRVRVEENQTTALGPTAGPPVASMFFGTTPYGATVAVNAPFPFASAGPVVGVGGPSSNGPGTIFTIITTGTYRIGWNVPSITEAGQLALYVNGVIQTVVGGTSGRATGTAPIQHELLIALVAGNTVEVRNPAGNAAALTVTVTPGGTHQQNPALIFELLSTTSASGYSIGQVDVLEPRVTIDGAGGSGLGLEQNTGFPVVEIGFHFTAAGITALAQEGIPVIVEVEVPHTIGR